MSNRTRIPDSLDDLLSENRNRLDEMFVHQLAGGRMDREEVPTAPAAIPETSNEVSDASSANVVAELNRKFGLGWSSRTIGHSEDGERVTAEVELQIGDRSIVRSASSRIDVSGPEMARQRAVVKALESAADSSASKTGANGAPYQNPVQASAGSADLVTTNALETALMAIRAEVDSLVAATVVSPALTRLGACSASLMDSAGQMVSGDGGSFLSHMLETQKLHLDPGDVLLVSDPYGSAGASSSSNVWILVSPVFHGPDRIGYVSIRADVGGTVQGNTPANAASVFVEGVRIPLMKICAEGILNESVLSMILVNSRNPQASRADLMALIGASNAGAGQMGRLCARIGPNAFYGACARLLARTGDAIRSLIRSVIPDEPQSFEDQVDDDGCGNGPFKLRLTVWREGDHAYFDWTGTSAQAAGPINFYLHVGAAKALVGRVLTQMLSPGLSSNDGFYDLIHVTLPEGTVLKPAFPSAVSHHNFVMARHLDVLGAAICRKSPDRLHAAGGKSVASFRYVGDDFALVDFVPEGRGAGPDSDGTDPANGVETIEVLEADNPIVIESLRELPDTSGAGKYRGGPSTEKVYRLLSAGHVSIVDDRYLSRNWGVNGGGPGARSEKWIERADGGREKLPAKVESLPVHPGDVIVFRTAGGGGNGDPLTRDPELVLQDVAQQLLSADAAARDHGVVIDLAARRIDRRATEATRTAMMRDRQHPKLFDRGDPA